ncbi:MAG: OmpA family protein [Crocinitomicaceae bacterium]
MKYFFILISLFILQFSFAQNRTICPDVEGAVNHPILEKYKNSCIIAYDESKFNSVTFPISKISSYKEGAPKEITEEGKVTNIIFGIENNDRATVLEVQRNYEQALKKGGFEIVYSAFGKKAIGGNYKLQSAYPTFGEADVLSQYQYTKAKSYFRFSMSGHNTNIDKDEAYFVAQGKRDGKSYTLALYIRHNRTSWEGLSNNLFVLAQIVEKEEMETGQVSAASIDEKIKNEGKEVFHNILFEFGSDKLTEESYVVIETLAEYLKANNEQSYYVVGHTDNIGSLSANQTLSEKRALAVVKVLVEKYGVPASQLSAHGIGPLSPLAINTSEEGRALNRRVELVLK